MAFAVLALFHDQMLFFCMSSVGKMISPEGLEKKFIDFPNNTFPIKAGIINFFHYICGI